MKVVLNFDAVQLEAMRKGWTMNELAQKAGCGNNTFWALRQRGWRGRPSTFGKLAKALGVDVLEIVTITDGSQQVQG